MVLKVYEIRLYDSKRRKIKIGDKIIFLKAPELEKKIQVVVKDIVIAESLEEIFTKISPVLAGWSEEDTPSKCAKDMMKYYSLEEEKRNGAVAFKIELIKD
jgi:ASC-1-like (ASCH) protein